MWVQLLRVASYLPLVSSSLHTTHILAHLVPFCSPSPLNCFLFQPHLAPLPGHLKVRLFSCQETLSSLSHLSLFWALSPVTPGVRLRLVLCRLADKSASCPLSTSLITCDQHSLWDTSLHRPDRQALEGRESSPGSFLCLGQRLQQKCPLRVSSQTPPAGGACGYRGEGCDPPALRGKLAPGVGGGQERHSGKERKNGSSHQGRSETDRTRLRT